MAIAIYGLTDSAIDTAAAIGVSKMLHAYSYHLWKTGTIAADIGYFGPFRAAGTIVGFEAAITETVATGADRTVTCDLKKSTGGGAFATVLSAVITFNNGSTARTVSSATISSAAVVDNDMFSVNIAVAGAAGNQALGLVVRAFWTETYA